MIRHQLTALVPPVVDPFSRRRLVLRLGGASLVAATAAVTPHLAQAQDATPASDLEANKVLARRFHDEIFEQGNLDVADELLTPDFTWHSPPQTTFVVGPEAVKQVATDFRAFLPDLVSSDDDEIAEGDRVVIRWTTTGSAQTEAGGVPVIYTGIDIFRIADGKLAELWQNTDDYGLAQQLGEIPTEATPEAGTPTP
jgi:predicted SnoaL-like aldol condensation-catalyzing enzyme